MSVYDWCTKPNENREFLQNLDTCFSAPGAWDLIRRSMDQAFVHVLASAFQQASANNLPIDGSWRFEVWTDTEERDGSTWFTVSGAWRKVA